MTKLIQDLVALQTLLRSGEAATPEQKAQIEELRAAIPAPLLAHFLRQLASKRSGIALVRNGVCGECHLRVSHAMAHMLRHTQDLLICENCGAFLALAPEERAKETAPVAVAAKAKRGRRPRAEAYVAVA